MWRDAGAPPQQYCKAGTRWAAESACRWAARCHQQHHAGSAGATSPPPSSRHSAALPHLIGLISLLTHRVFADVGALRIDCIRVVATRSAINTLDRAAEAFLAFKVRAAIRTVVAAARLALLAAVRCIGLAYQCTVACCFIRIVAERALLKDFIRLRAWKEKKWVGRWAGAWTSRLLGGGED